MQGWNSEDKCKGTEEYGDPYNDTSAWSIKFHDKDISTVTVVSGDGEYKEEYEGDDCDKKKYEKDKLLNSEEMLQEMGGAKVYIHQCVGPNQIWSWEQGKYLDDKNRIDLHSE